MVGRKADIGVHEQQMGRRGIVEEKRHEICPRAGDQRVAVAHQNRQVEIGPGTNGALQMEDRPGVDAGDLSAETGGGHLEVNMSDHDQLRSPESSLQA